MIFTSALSKASYSYLAGLPYIQAAIEYSSHIFLSCRYIIFDRKISSIYNNIKLCRSLKSIIALNHSSSYSITIDEIQIIEIFLIINRSNSLRSLQ